MPPPLPSVLSPIDLPLAELAAARLDGELFGIDGCYAPIDEIEQPAHRALALRTGIHERLIAEQLTAAWVWGALREPPTSHQLCATLGARVSRTSVAWRTVREVVIDQTELVTVAGMQVTVPLRTVVDIVRFATRFGSHEIAAVAALLRIADITVDDAVAQVNGRRNLPNKKRALARLARVDSVDVVDRVDTTHGIEHAVEVGGVPHLEDETAERKTLARG